MNNRIAVLAYLGVCAIAVTLVMFGYNDREAREIKDVEESDVELLSEDLKGTYRQQQHFEIEETEGQIKVLRTENGVRLSEFVFNWEAIN